MEANGSRRVSRGGSCYNAGTSYPASNRATNAPTTITYSIGIRTAIYIN